jgi:hypothetical protein
MEHEVAIPEAQLETWSHQGSITNSSNTYNTIKNVLGDVGTPYAEKNYEVFLQGSYGNDTNIWSESDVDIVIKLASCFHSDLSNLTDDDRAAWRQAHSDATYGYVEFKRDVLKVLTAAYANDVGGGDKAIAIAPRGNRRKADVIVATEFRRYLRFKSAGDQLYTSGICFWNKGGERIANFPKQHSANLTAKHQATGSWLKPMIRIVKNLRGRLVEDRLLPSGSAPSYFLEGLLYNVPTSLFATSYGSCYVNALNWLRMQAKKENLLCANEQYYLLRDNAHECWPPANADAFLDAAANLWERW